jgi:hypothetical protein
VLAYKRQKVTMWWGWCPRHPHSLSSHPCCSTHTLTPSSVARHKLPSNVRQFSTAFMGRLYNLRIIYLIRSKKRE